jgi:hypothetical protein
VGAAAARPASTRPAGIPAEVTTIHTRILRVTLGVEEARSYWEHVDASVPLASRSGAAFEQRWFGGKSLERVRFLISTFEERFDPFPGALEALRRFMGLDPVTRQLICHFHVQLSDPIYRAFTGRFLVRRRGLRSPTVDRDAAVRWLRDEYPDRWSAATEVQFASKLLTATSEAGLVTAKKDPRSVLLPKVTDMALTYLLYSLRVIRFEGTLLENPYLASLGLTEGFLEQRLRSLPGIAFRRMGELVDFEWAYPTLAAWAEATS